MTLLLWIFGLGVMADLCMVWTSIGWRMRRMLAAIAVVLAGFGTGALLWWWPNVFSVLIGMFGLYRAFNSIRIVEGRMHERYLRTVTRRTAVSLVGLQVLVMLGWLAWQRLHTDGHAAWAVIGALQLAVAGVLLVSTIRRMQRTAWPRTVAHRSDAELPTLTVAIPARNETEDLQSCLQSLVASDYPKLEIVVLDDCSQIRRTPEIIRDFAQDGVRFVQGEQPRETWLPKNQAYDRLADEASGEYILFAGVDVRFEVQALRQIVTTLLDRNKRMLCILPERAPEVRGHISLAQAMRYIWELVPPRRLFRRPPVLSSCWIIKKDALKAAGGFDAVARSIVPEAHFAHSVTAADGYGFMRSGKNPGVRSVKAIAAQRDTAIRTRYPQLHRRPENVLLLSLLELVFLIGPFILAGTGLLFNAGRPAIVMAGIAAMLLTVTYQIVGHATKISSMLFGFIALPLAAVYDLGMLHYSMWKYEFSEVDWKGRNICIPAMHVVPRLPRV